MNPDIRDGDDDMSGEGERNSGEMTLKKQGFYQKAAWRRVRRQALERDHYLCQECLRHKRFTRATEVHHKKPAEEYPELALTLSNLESLCWNCHEQTKHRAGSDTGTKVSSGVRVIKI